jgi:hypothetical protein
MLCLSSCAKKESTEASKPESPAAQPGGGPHAVIPVTDGSSVPGTIVASSPTGMTVAGDDGIERKIPMTQVKSVEYGDARPARQVPRERAPAKTVAGNEPARAPVAPPI